MAPSGTRRGTLNAGRETLPERLTWRGLRRTVRGMESFQDRSTPALIIMKHGMTEGPPASSRPPSGVCCLRKTGIS
jgi:hypothetical protein